MFFSSLTFLAENSYILNCISIMKLNIIIIQCVLLSIRIIRYVKRTKNEVFFFYCFLKSLHDNCVE